MINGIGIFPRKRRGYIFTALSQPLPMTPFSEASREFPKGQDDKVTNKN